MVEVKSGVVMSESGKAVIVSCSTEAVIRRLEVAIDAASSNGVGDSMEDSLLLAASGEALGALRVLGSVSMSQILYDFARLAGYAGQVPDDFEEKSRGV